MCASCGDKKHISKALGNAIYSKTLSDSIHSEHGREKHSKLTQILKSAKAKALNKRSEQTMRNGLKETGKRMMAQNKK